MCVHVQMKEGKGSGVPARVWEENKTPLFLVILRCLARRASLSSARFLKAVLLACKVIMPLFLSSAPTYLSLIVMRTSAQATKQRRHVVKATSTMLHDSTNKLAQSVAAMSSITYLDTGACVCM